MPWFAIVLVALAVGLFAAMSYVFARSTHAPAYVEHEEKGKADAGPSTELAPEEVALLANGDPASVAAIMLMRLVTRRKAQFISVMPTVECRQLRELDNPNDQRLIEALTPDNAAKRADMVCRLLSDMYDDVISFLEDSGITWVDPVAAFADGHEAYFTTTDHLTPEGNRVMVSSMSTHLRDAYALEPQL